MKGNFKTKITILILLLVIAIVLSVAFGSVRIPVKHTAKIILSEIPFIGERIDLSGIDETDIFIVNDLRLPRIIMAGLVGATLSLAGASFQAVFNNPMADPYIMGVSAGAALGATIGIILGASSFGFGAIGTFAFAGSVIAGIIVFNLGKIAGKINTVSVLLSGVVVGAILSSMVNFLMMMNRDNLHRIMSWTMGSFSGVTVEEVKAGVIPFIIGLIIMISLSKELNALVLGESLAHSMGVDVEKTKLIILALASLMSALAVSVSGIIGFVGLIVPHLFRLMFGSNHSKLLPASAFGGALFLIVCDTLARSLMETQEIPVGIITSFFGGPFFLYLLRNSKKRTEGGR